MTQVTPLVRERNARPGRNPPARDERRVPGPVDLGPLAEWIGFQLRLAQNASFQAFAHEARGVDLSPGRFATLMLIARNPGITQTALSRANARDKSSLTPVIEDLARRKLIRRAHARGDRRSYRLELTPAGETLLARLTECAERHERRLNRVFRARERDRFLQDLKQVVSALTDTDAAGRHGNGADAIAAPRSKQTERHRG